MCVGPGTATHAYNLSYSGGRDTEGLKSKTGLCKKLVKPHVNKQIRHSGSSMQSQLHGKC
jgi:hypothetical protein